MPKPVKPELLIPEMEVEPIQGTTIVVIHPGSSMLQLGRATDHFPRSIPHVIARRVLDDNLPLEQEHPLYRVGIMHEESDDKRAHGFKSAKNFINATRLMCGKKKPKVTHGDVASYNSQVHPAFVEGEENVSWTDFSNLPDYLIGEQVLTLHSSAPYFCRWPYANGQLNVNEGVGNSLSSIAADLETLWGSAIETYLNIPIKDLSYYRAVLLIPDIFNRNHVKTLVDIILSRLKFSRVTVAQESVCGTFGSGLSSACVVDCGAQKTSICCVEDGISLPATRLTLNYGGNDITRSFFWLLQMANLPYKMIDLYDKLDIQLLQDLKETFCHMSLNIPPGQVHEFQVMRPGEKTLLYKLRLGDEPLLAPITMFIPDFFGIMDENLIETFPENQEHEVEDLMDDRYLLEKKEGDTKKKGDTEGNDAQSHDILNITSSTPEQHEKLQNIRKEGMPLDEAIMYSIEKCRDVETKRKMYSTVLLIGGGLNFKGCDEFLLKRLQSLLPNHYQFVKDQMEVIVKPKENDPQTACWKGGAVMSILDSSQELWLGSKEWSLYGVRVLRERCGFQWSTNMDKQ